MPRKLRFRRLQRWALATLLALSGVAAPITDAQELGDKIIDEQFGTVIYSARWETRKIEVCLENGDDSNGRNVILIRKALAATWEKYSAVTFVGFEACTAPKQPGVHILFGDGRPRTLSVGKRLNARPGGVVLNFDFASWRPACATPDQHDACVEAVAAHEFGHVLGFTHEQLGPYRQPMCTDEPEDFLGDRLLTAPDLGSIMSYCNPKWNGDGKLSKLDQTAAKLFYGAPLA